MNPNDFDKLVEDIKGKSSEKALAMIKQHFLLSDEEKTVLEEVVTLIEETLNQGGIMCQLFPYGATQTGLAIKSSHVSLNIFVCLDGKR